MEINKLKNIDNIRVGQSWVCYFRSDITMCNMQQPRDYYGEGNLFLYDENNKLIKHHWRRIKTMVEYGLL